MNQQATLDVLRDSEVVFPDTFAYTPSRTIKVPTDAPVQSLSVDISPASGTFAFPHDSPFSDRFIVWRSIGQTLYLEERSLRTNLSENCLAFNFTRSSVIPGANITVFDNVLSLVVPTQSSVHRFFARLMSAKQDPGRKEVPSVLSQFGAEECLREFHESHLVATQGHPLRASIAQRTGETKIAYVMYEGTVVHIHMPNDTRQDCEETVLRDANFISWIVGGKRQDQNCALDACTLLDWSRSRHSHPQFYVVYRNMSLRAWNGETRGLIHSIDLNDMLFTKIDNKNDLTNMIVRCVDDERGIMVLIGISTVVCSEFLLLRDTGTKLEKVISVRSRVKAPLLDAVTWRVCGGDTWRLWALWNDTAAVAQCILQHTSFCISPKSRDDYRTRKETLWSQVQLQQTRGTNLSPDAGPEIYRTAIFNRDNHSYGVVCRAVQIVCQGRVFHSEIEQDWSGLRDAVDLFLRTPEFDQKYGRGGSVSQEVAALNLLRKLAQACYDLENASRTTTSLFHLHTPTVSSVGVIQQNRITCVCEASPVLLAQLELENFPLHSKHMDEFTSAIEAALIWSIEKEDANDSEIVALPPFNPRADLSVWIKILEIILEHISPLTRGGNGLSPGLTVFGGAFTSGIVSANIRKQLRSSQATAHNIAQFCRVLLLLPPKAVGNDNRRSLLSAIEKKAQNLSKSLRIMAEQLNVLLNSQNAYTSLCSWMTLGDGLVSLLQEGSSGGGEGEEDQDSLMDDDRPNDLPFNKFVEECVKAAFCCLHPANQTFVLCKMLAKQRRFSSLKAVLDILHVPNPSPGYMFHQAVALSGCNKPTQAIEYFTLCLPHARHAEASLRTALSEGPQIESDKILATFYLQAIRVLHEHGHSTQVIELSRTAIADLRDDPQSRAVLDRIHITLFTQEADRQEWASALAAIHTCQNPESRLLTLRELMSRLLSGRHWEHITALDFGDLHENVATILSARARNDPPNFEPNVYELLSAYHIARNEYLQAASAMYEWALRLRDEPRFQNAELLKKRRDALAAASTFVDLLGSDDYIFFHKEVEEVFTELDEDIFPSEETRTRRHRVRGQKRNKTELVVFTGEQINKQFALANARYALVEAAHEAPPTDVQEILEELIDRRMYDRAAAFAKLFELSQCNLMAAVTSEAIAIDCDPAVAEVSCRWPNENQTYVLARTSSGDHWDVVRGLVDFCLNSCPADTRPLHTVLHTIIRNGLPVPSWLETVYLDVDIGGYLRTLVEFDSPNAITAALTAINKFVDSLQNQVRSVDSRVLLPYTPMDEVFELCSRRTTTNEETNLLFKVVRDKVSALQKRMQGFSNASKFSVVA